MQRTYITITNEQGLHARPAKIFIREAKKFSSTIRIGLEGKEVNGKSILELLSLGAGCGKEIALMVDGDDEVAAMGHLTQLIERGLE